MNTFPDVHGLQLEHISGLFVWGLAGSYTTRSPLKKSRGAAPLRVQGSPVTADCGLAAAGVGRGKQPGKKDSGSWGMDQAPVVSLPRALVNPEPDQFLEIKKKWFPSTAKVQGTVGRGEIPPFWKKDSKILRCPRGRTDQSHTADHLLPPPPAASQPREQRQGPPQGLQLLCVLPQTPGSEQGAQRSMGLHGVQSETAPGLGGQGGLRHLVEKPFPIWQPTEVSSAHVCWVGSPSHTPQNSRTKQTG